MRILVSAIALAIALAWPSVGDAHGKKTTARSTVTTQQKQATRQKTVRQKTTRQTTTRVRTAVQPRTAQKPCAGYLWWGCVGWDPDPNVRATLVRDLADTP